MQSGTDKTPLLAGLAVDEQSMIVSYFTKAGFLSVEWSKNFSWKKKTKLTFCVQSIPNSISAIPFSNKFQPFLKKHFCRRYCYIIEWQCFKSQRSFLNQCRKSYMFRVTQMLFTKTGFAKKNSELTVQNQNTLSYYNDKPNHLRLLTNVKDKKRTRTSEI